MRQKSADTANRGGVAERFPAPAVHQSVAVDLALMDFSAPLLRDGALTSVQTAKQHAAQTLSLLPSVPGLGTIVRVVLRYEIHARTRCPRVQDVVAYGRVVKCAKASAGKRYGTAGTKLGNASLQWAFSAAAVLFLRNNPAGQKSLAR